MAKVCVWTKETASKELKKRLESAKQARKPHEEQWRVNEQVAFSSDAAGLSLSGGTLSATLDSSAEEGEDDATISNIGINYIYKNIRFVQANASANPPSVVPKPATNDVADIRRADVADRIIKYSMRQYSIQNKKDISALYAITYGTGFMKQYFNPDLGEVISFDQETMEVETTGDMALEPVSPFKVFPEPACDWAAVTWVFEEVELTIEEALYRFPESEEQIKALKKDDDAVEIAEEGSPLQEYQKRIGTITCYQYWEAGTPYNGLIGRYCWCLKDGTLLTPISPNPHTRRSGKNRSIKIAKLPYHIWTYGDIPGTFWGSSPVTMAAPVQVMLHGLDNLALDNVRAHGVTRLLVQGGASIDKQKSVTTSPYDIIVTEGQINYLPPMQGTPDIYRLRESLRTAIDELFGINESMQGVQSRETAATAMQWATQQGSMNFRRFFNKYTEYVESIYKTILAIAVEHWEDGRVIATIGKEQAFETIDFKSSDVDSGQDFVSEYGSSFSLDPITRREELMTLAPLFKEAGMSARQILAHLKLSQMGELYDLSELSSRRQREIFEEMIAENIYIKPEEEQQHQLMLEWAATYVMTAEFRDLKSEHKALIIQHIKDRREMAAQVITPAPAAPVAPTMGLPPPPPPLA